MGQLTTRFGAVGAKGEAGEIFMLDELKKQYKVSDYRLDMVQQTQGIDFGISKDGWRREFTLDVKNNLYITPEFYAFKIELEANGKAGWFFTSKADRIYHTNAYMKQYNRKYRKRKYEQFLRLKEENKVLSIALELATRLH